MRQMNWDFEIIIVNLTIFEIKKKPSCSLQVVELKTLENDIFEQITFGDDF